MMFDEDKDVFFMLCFLCVYKGYVLDVLDVLWLKVNLCFLFYMCLMLRKFYFDVKFV